MGFLESVAFYNFLRGPMVWLTFIIFILGSIYKIFYLIKLGKEERVIFPFLSMKATIKSVLHWLIPYGSRNWRLRPFFTILTSLFHICLIFTPIFLLGHNLLLYESWGISWWTLPEALADIMSIVVIVGSVLFFLRRIFSPTARFVTTLSDYIFIGICFFTFLTGFLAHHQLLLSYRAMLNLHIIFGEIMLICIPFTRLVHMYYFFLTRAWMGSQFAWWKTKDW
ncbi:TmcC family electron transfer complex membrane anchor subunit [Thermodesulfobacterium hydrogeniphilum]|uniref:TmcC family electron transfer complex membrane anchor subunit n=1 Tax=Thermodesulfobacterium hydrogeniphilum TaxID=161156 RepID=UPI0005704132|nr:nitrate reductase [Thermodesulfobacterium hydrogeniphilum]